MASFFRMIEGRPAPITEQTPVLPLTRSNDVGGFRRRFRPEILYYQFKLNFFSLFDNKCFKCKKLAAWDIYPESDEMMGGLLRQKQLLIDHHVALENGGRYQPGNLVSLCQRCNGRKHTMHPEDFY
ncbi:MAG: HNH endonuclease, partial [Pirellulaceae bacterium]